MATVEYDRGVEDPRNPLIARVNPKTYNLVLMRLNILGQEASERVVVVKAGVFTTNYGHLIAATFDPASKKIALFPETEYPKYLRDLAFIDSEIEDLNERNKAVKEITLGLDNKLTRYLFHEARHDGDNHLGIAYSKTAVRIGLTYGPNILGSSLGVLLSSAIFPNNPAVQIGTGIVLTNLASLFIEPDSELVYKVNPFEIHARRFQNMKRIPYAWRGLVSTAPNPSVDLRYRHNFPQNDGSVLSITNRQILNLRDF